jgi:two-component system, OmpR family, response regulator MprA
VQTFLSSEPRTPAPCAASADQPPDGSLATALNQPLILLIETSSSFLDPPLAVAGYRVKRSPDGPLAVTRLEELAADIVLLDVAQPGTVTLELVRQLRTRSGAPIVMLASSESLEDRVAGLDAGADDYLVKPFALAELLARLRALLRGRALAVASARHGVLAYADLRLDLDTRQAWRGQRRLELRNKGFELLASFMRHSERVLTRAMLLQDAWGYDFLGDSNVIDVTISHLRRALEAGGEARLIHTVRPIGYILNARA